MRSNASGSGGSFIIRVADASAVLQERLYISNAGNVGINTTSPASALTIASAGELRVYRSDNTRSGLEKKQQTKSTPVTEQESLFVTEEEQAVKLLKSLGYKIFKQFTDFREI